MTNAFSLALLISVLSAPQPELRSPPFVGGYDRFFDKSGEQQELGGELLLSELSCTACHATDNDLLKPKRGPRLDGVGLRLQPAWLLRYISDPNHVQPGTTMPNVVPRGTEGTVLEPLLAFLSSRQKSFPELVSTAGNPIAFEFWKKGNRERGQTLYHQVGCVACHEPDAEVDAGTNNSSDLENLLSQLEPDEIRELGLENAAKPVRSVPHGDLAAKYTRKSLTFFLLDPSETRPSGRMPSLKLKPDEAADIAAYLLRDQRDDTAIDASSTDSDLIKEGRRWFVELRCVNCHDVDGAKPTRFGKPLAELDVDAAGSCISGRQEGLPKYYMSGDQASALKLAVAVASRPRTAESTDLESLDLRMMQLNCYACHERDQLGGVGPNRRGYFETIGHVDLGDEGRLPPPLDGVGRKLTEAWFKQVLAGTGDIRPHLHARMPVFAQSQVASLPTLFAKSDAAVANPMFRSFEKSGTLKELAESGRALLDLGCVQCHPCVASIYPESSGSIWQGSSPACSRPGFATSCSILRSSSRVLACLLSSRMVAAVCQRFSMATSIARSLRCGLT
ncbi:MAG: cytochrome c [Planctomycetales bacterium]|nr:cytochrome c [Planctomycetales bacterium]